MEDIRSESSTGAPNGAPAHATESLSLHARPTVADLHGENHFAQVARKNWLGGSKAPKVRPEVVKKELWDELETIDFAYPSLLVLENLQLLERYLWPGFTEDASNYHHLLLALMVNVKRRENLPSWGKNQPLTLHRSCANVYRRTLRRQTVRILFLLPAHPVHERRLLTTQQDQDTPHFVRHRRIPVIRQRPSSKGMRTSSRHIDMAQSLFRRGTRTAF